MIEIGGGNGVKGSFTNKATRDLLAAATATGKVLKAVTIKLYTDGPEPSPSASLDDFTEATFTGYAPVTAAEFGVPSWEGDYAQMVSLAITNRFASTGTAIQETVK